MDPFDELMAQPDPFDELMSQPEHTGAGMLQDSTSPALSEGTGERLYATPPVQTRPGTGMGDRLMADRQLNQLDTNGMNARTRGEETDRRAAVAEHLRRKRSREREQPAIARETERARVRNAIESGQDVPDEQRSILANQPEEFSELWDQADRDYGKDNPDSLWRPGAMASTMSGFSNVFPWIDEVRGGLNAGIEHLTGTAPYDENLSQTYDRERAGIENMQLAAQREPGAREYGIPGQVAGLASTLPAAAAQSGPTIANLAFSAAKAAPTFMGNMGQAFTTGATLGAGVGTGEERVANAFGTGVGSMAVAAPLAAYGSLQSRGTAMADLGADEYMRAKGVSPAEAVPPPMPRGQIPTSNTAPPADPAAFSSTRDMASAVRAASPPGPLSTVAAQRAAVADASALGENMQNAAGATMRSRWSTDLRNGLSSQMEKNSVETASFKRGLELVRAAQLRQEAIARAEATVRPEFGTREATIAVLTGGKSLAGSVAGRAAHNISSSLLTTIGEALERDPMALGPLGRALAGKTGSALASALYVLTKQHPELQGTISAMQGNGNGALQQFNSRMDSATVTREE